MQIRGSTVVEVLLFQPQLNPSATNPPVKEERESPTKTPLKGFPVKFRGISKY